MQTRHRPGSTPAEYKGGPVKGSWPPALYSPSRTLFTPGLDSLAFQVFTIPRTSDTLRRRRWHPTPVLLPGKSHGWRSLVGYSPWGHEESDRTERLHFHFSLSCIGEGNANPLQCSCLENPRDGRAWWAAVYGVAQSRTRLKRLSSSSSSRYPSLWPAHPDSPNTRPCLIVGVGGWL